MSKILCSTGALLEYGGDYKLLEPLSKQLLCDGYNDTFTVEAVAHNDKGIVDVKMLNDQFRYIRTCVS